MFLNLMLVTSCWGSVESLERKVLIDVQYDINSLYFGYVFAEEYNRLFKAIMVSVRQVYDRYEQEHWPEGHFAPDNQTEARQLLLTRLFQEATRHTIANVTGGYVVDETHPGRPMFHLLQAFSNAPAMEESRDVNQWYQTQPVLLQGVLAEDRRDSMESLIEEAVLNSFRAFPSNPLSPKELARQLGFILVEMQELFLRGKGLRSLGYKVEQQKQNPEIANDPAFILYLSFLTERFNSHDTLWHTESQESKWRQQPEDLSALFMEAAHRENYGIEWYQQVRRILDGEKPVSEKLFRQHFSREDELESWIKTGLSVPVVTVISTMVVYVRILLYVYEMFSPRLRRALLNRFMSANHSSLFQHLPVGCPMLPEFFRI
ncbi:MULTISPECIES: hypothetical protein [unclassified Endozoicomonas]|uniref:hypothetical protein n=1 Tax=unclassified Endozoicomonas TaxID=2644528 RepID=UPI002148D1E5|nr:MULTISPECIES: hypothetical protein [unclassified Endozoicomonas]